MAYRVEHRKSKLSVSLGMDGIMFNIVRDGVSNAITLSHDEARVLRAVLGEMIEQMAAVLEV